MLRLPPVRELHQEDVVRGSTEHPAHAFPKPEGAVHARIRAVLGPDEEQRGAGQVFPAQDRVPPQRSEREVGIVEPECGNAGRGRCDRELPVAGRQRGAGEAELIGPRLGQLLVFAVGT